MQNFKRTLLAAAVGARRLRHRRRAVHRCVLLRRQPDATSAPSSRCCRRAPECSRPIPVRFGRSRLRNSFGFSVQPRQSGRHRLRVRRRARDAVARIPAVAPTAAAVPIATQVHAVSRQGTARPERASIRSRAALTTSLRSLRTCRRARSRQTQAQANLTLAATRTRRGRSAKLRAAGAQYISSGDSERRRMTPDVRRESGDGGQVTAFESGLLQRDS